MGLILLDRDGVLNKDLTTSVRSVAEFELLPFVGSAIARLNQAGHSVVVVTNQAVVGRGEISLQTLEDIHTHMQKLLEKEKAHVDQIIYCTDAHPSPRRKPAPGMLLEALEMYQAIPSQTPFVGDALRDLEAAAAAGCRPFLVKTGKGAVTLEAGLPPPLEKTPVFNNLTSFVDFWLKKGVSLS